MSISQCGIRLGTVLFTLLVYMAQALPVSAQMGQVDTLLSIGLTDGPQDYLFARPVRVAPAPGGAIAVLDAEYRTLRLFDSAGRFLRGMGRAGQGPAEFVNPLGLSVVDSTIHVVDLSGRLTAFSMDGRYLYDRSLPQIAGGRARYLFPLRHGYSFVVRAGRYSTAGTDNRELLVLTSDVAGRAADTLSSHDPGTVLRRSPPPVAQMLQPAAIPMPPEAVWAVGGDSLIVIIDGYRGTLRWLAVTPTGLVQRPVRRLAWEPQPFGGPADMNNVRDRVLARHPGMQIVELVVPRFLGRAWRAILDDQGRAWINLFDGLDLTTTWLVVSQDADDLPETVTLPDGFYLHAVANGRLYGTTRTSLDVPVVQVLRLRGRSQ